MDATNQCLPTVGSIVFSKAGRDKGSYYIVTALEGEFAYICDGDIRRNDKPKKKKLKHLKVTNTVCESISDKISETGRVTNPELRKAIAEFCDISKLS